MPDRGSVFSKIQNQNEAMTTQNVLARSASRTGKKLISKIADKARKIKSSGNERSVFSFIVAKWLSMWPLDQEVPSSIPMVSIRGPAIPILCQYIQKRTEEKI